MIDALYNGISGLNVNQSALNTQSNNISNVNTVGYKSDKISFSDLMYQNSIGKGSAIASVTKDFTQGDLKTTNNALDVAIDGKGYFMVKGNSAEVNYTRSGNFRVGSDGTLQMPNGYNVLGFVPLAPEIKSSNTNDTKFTSEFSNFISSKVSTSTNGEKTTTINAKSTNFNTSASNDLIESTGKNYKTKEAKISDVEKIITLFKNELSIYDINNIVSEPATLQESSINFGSNLAVGDSLKITIGNNVISQTFTNNTVETLNNLSNKISNIQGLSASVDTATGKLDIKSLLPGESIKISDASITNNGIKTNLTVNTTEAIAGEGKARLDSLEAQVDLLLQNAGAKYLRISNSIDASNPKDKTLSNIQMDLKALGVSDNSFGETEIENGLVYIKQGNTKFAVGKIMISSFISEEGLTPKGGNLYSKSALSGEPVYADNTTKVRNKVLELSNSDLAVGLVDLMVYQRAFEANSKSITTSDEFLKTAIQLKK